MNNNILLEAEKAITRKASSKVITISDDGRYVDQYLESSEDLKKTLIAYDVLNKFWPLAPIITVDYQKRHIRSLFSGLPIRLVGTRHILKALQLLEADQFNSTLNNMFNKELVCDELNLFYHWFLKKALNVHTTELYDVFLNLFINYFQTVPKRLVHRDFHCENILYTEGGSLRLVDYQDAIMGPYNYDYASLIGDAYQDTSAFEALSMSRYKLWAKSYSNRVEEDFLIVRNQRLMKMVGIFSRLSLRDSKTQYLQYIPRLLERLITYSHNFHQKIFFQKFLILFKQRY